MCRHSCIMRKMSMQSLLGGFECVLLLKVQPFLLTLMLVSLTSLLFHHELIGFIPSMVRNFVFKFGHFVHWTVQM